MSHGACRFFIRTQAEPLEVLQFVISGLEVGQQVVALAGPTWLKELAASLNGKGFRSECMLRSGRLVFLTAPHCFVRSAKPATDLYHSALRRNGSIVRWVTDWSWAYGNGAEPDSLRIYQHRLHKRMHELTALSLCTIHFNGADRKPLLAALMDHRRAAVPPRMGLEASPLHLAAGAPA